MAASSNATSSLAGLSKPTIETIRQAALASAPSVAAPFINARFDAASSASGPAGYVPYPLPYDGWNVSPSVIGSSLAQPTISFIREQILDNAPSAYASIIAEQFTAAATGSNQAAPAEGPAQSAAPSEPEEPAARAHPAPEQPAASAQPVAPVPPAASNNVNAESAAIGQAFAAPAIEFVRQQIMSVLPAEYSASILARFPDLPAASSDAASTQPTTPASVQASVVINEIRAYFAAQYTSSP